jgi:hypothetical protein
MILTRTSHVYGELLQIRGPPARVTLYTGEVALQILHLRTVYLRFLNIKYTYLKHPSKIINEAQECSMRTFKGLPLFGRVWRFFAPDQGS